MGEVYSSQTVETSAERLKWRDEPSERLSAGNRRGNRKLKTGNECFAINGTFNLLSVNAETFINIFAMQYIGGMPHLVRDAVTIGTAQ